MLEHLLTKYKRRSIKWKWTSKR